MGKPHSRLAAGAIDLEKWHAICRESTDGSPIYGREPEVENLPIASRVGTFHFSPAHSILFLDVTM